MLVVFVEFADLTHDDTLWPMADLLAQLDLAETYVEAQSYGQLNIDYTIVPQWVTLAENASDFATSSVNFGETLDPIKLGWQAALGAKAQGIDFTTRSEQFDSILVVTPPRHFFGGLAISVDIPTDDVPINEPKVNFATLTQEWVLSPRNDPPVLSLSIVGGFPNGARGTETTQHPWHTTAAHEMMHNLGLNDLYPYNRDGRVGRGGGDGYVVGNFGRMWLEGVWADEASPRALIEDTTADTANGEVSPADVSVSTRPWPTEELAWSRWRLGWFDDDDVECLDVGTSTLSLGPVAAPGEDTAFAMLPLTTNQLLVLEARRRVGYDADQLVRTVALEPDVYNRLLAEEGVLAYIVDTNIGNGDVPIAVLGDDGTGFAQHSPILTVDEGVTLTADNNGPTVEVEVTRDAGATFAVSVDWQAGTGTAAAYTFDVERRDGGEVVDSDAARPATRPGTIATPDPPAPPPDATTNAINHSYAGPPTPQASRRSTWLTSQMARWTC